MNLVLYFFYKLLIVVSHLKGTATFCLKVCRKIVLHISKVIVRFCCENGLKMFCELTKCRKIILGPVVVIRLSYDHL